MMHPTQEMMDMLKKTVSFDVSEVPEIATWDVGKEYTLELTVTQQSRHEVAGEKMSAVFVIEKVEAIEKDDPQDEAGTAPIIPSYSLGGQDK